MLALVQYCEKLSDYGVSFNNDESSACPKWVRFMAHVGLQVSTILSTYLAVLCDLVSAAVYKIWSCFDDANSADLSEKACTALKMGVYGGHLVVFLALRRLFCPCETEISYRSS